MPVRVKPPTPHGIKGPGGSEGRMQPLLVSFGGSFYIVVSYVVWDSEYKVPSCLKEEIPAQKTMETI